MAMAMTAAAAALSSVRFLTGADQLLKAPMDRIGGSGGRSSEVSVIRMGGGPRTYPGGVSKWQWKRMQMKKAKQLLKARLCRERQIYEMRKRAELKSAISELERPWEAVERAAAAAPNLFSVAADEQLKVLADRFQKPGGFDMWSRSDGPQILRPFDGLPSARFFPKGVVHSLKPYGGAATASAAGDEEDEEEDDELQFDDWVARGKGGTRRTRHHRRGRRTALSQEEEDGAREAGTTMGVGSSYPDVGEVKDERIRSAGRSRVDFLRGRRPRGSELPSGGGDELGGGRMKRTNSRDARRTGPKSVEVAAFGRVGRLAIGSSAGPGSAAGRRSQSTKSTRGGGAASPRRRKAFNWSEDDISEDAFWDV
ncbi:unnamed protein product [Spirodela intermedia]|uniref:Uncharacterized protein n=1 Tax=Spirodela intermedia TaxID=51605 RepID=A0A7I8KNE2_SPIIN|nr:unnamed protein product [Spirodela intermedia]